jgi:hypothetical protein
METIFTLLFAVIFTSAFAYDEGKITVSFAAKNNVQVFIDGRAYQPEDNIVSVNNVQSGQHSIKIYRAKRAGRNNGNKNELLYSNTVYVKPAYHVDVMVNRFGKALIDERALRSDNRYDDNDWNQNNDGAYGNGNNYNQAMSDYDFNGFIQKIKSQWFNSGKINTAKDGLTKSYFTTYQVKTVLQLFSSESDKLELAKLSYRNTVDPRNYYQLYDVFSFQSSKDDLDRYLKDYRY